MYFFQTIVLHVALYVLFILSLRKGLYVCPLAGLPVSPSARWPVCPLAGLPVCRFSRLGQCTCGSRPLPQDGAS